MWGTLIGAGLGLLGQSSAEKAAKKEAKAKRAAMERLAGVTFNPQDAFGPGGVGMTFGPNGIGTSLGQYQGLFDQQGQAAAMNLGGGGPLGMLGNQAFGNAQQAFNPFQQGLQDTFFGGAQTNAALAGRGFDQLQADTLSTLRQQAQPFEERAFSNLQDNQFATGRLGSTGGGIQTEAFARGLGQADLQRQLAASGEARNAMASSLQAAEGMAGAGQNLRGFQGDLLNQALGQFQNITGFQQELGNMQLGNQQNIGNMPMQMGQFAGDLATARAQTDIAAAGGQGEIAMGGNFGNRDMSRGAFLGQLGQNVSAGGADEIFNKFSNWWGGRNNNATKTAPPGGSTGLGGGSGVMW